LGRQGVVGHVVVDDLEDQFDIVVGGVELVDDRLLRLKGRLIGAGAQANEPANLDDVRLGLRFLGGLFSRLFRRFFCRFFCRLLGGLLSGLLGLGGAAGGKSTRLTLITRLKRISIYLRDISLLLLFLS
jgi:hypothetical protein